MEKKSEKKEGNNRTFGQDMRILAALFVGALCLGGIAWALCSAGKMSRDIMAIIIAVSLCLMPLRKITAMLLPWLVEYLCSIDNALAQIIEPKVVTKPLNPADKPYLNLGITRLAQAVVWAIWAVIAALASALPGVTVRKIEMMLHSITTTFSRMVGTLGSRVAFFLWLVLTIGLVVLVIAILWMLYKNAIKALEGKPPVYDVIPWAWFLLGYVIVKKVFNYFFYDLTPKMGIFDLLFWWVIVGLVALIYWIVSLIRNR